MASVVAIAPLRVPLSLRSTVRPCRKSAIALRTTTKSTIGGSSSPTSVIRVVASTDARVPASRARSAEEPLASAATARSTAPATAVASAALSSLTLAALPALAELDADGVPKPNILTTIFFTIAVALLAVITLGVLYLSAREALDKQEEIRAREEDERAERVVAANKGRVPGMKKEKKKKLSPSQRAGELGPNRRERRRMEREGIQVDDQDEA